ncbi:hypothetical protein [Horticoccus sp. 23ND18S-11]|uniref:hypothetical protein n=1 Tax=Horticoccus sp. 23ND18S-11 TaxID=3391832 RepID=UPI0039C96725
MKSLRSARFLALSLIAVLVVAFGLMCVQQACGTLAAVGVFVGFNLMFAPKVSHVFGAAATAARNTDTRPGDLVYLPVAATTTIYAGTLVARDANGRAVPASDTAGLRVVGRAEETVDNAAGAAGDLSINIRLGCFKFDNSATAAVDADDIGKMAVVEDDQTVAETSTNGVSAGRITGVDSDGVWVDTRFAFYGPKAVPTLTSTNGTMAASANDAATVAEGEKIGDDVRALHASFFG